MRDGRQMVWIEDGYIDDDIDGYPVRVTLGDVGRVCLDHWPTDLTVDSRRSAFPPAISGT